MSPRRSSGLLWVCWVVVLLLAAGLGGEAQARSRRTTARAPYAGYADLVIEADTGRILRERSGSQLRYPASLTKMMTLYLTFQAIEAGRVRLDSFLPVSAHASVQPPSKLGLRAGQRLRVYDAILALVTKSANDAAMVLAEGLAGSEGRFVTLMNEQARALGMNRTTFRNPSGLPDRRQVTTARDMATLALALVSHYPGFYPYFSHEQFRYAGQTFQNHNHLLKNYRGLDGIKTGYINDSGFNLVASAVRGETRLIGVIFGGNKSKTRDSQMARLLDTTFNRLAHEKRARTKATGTRLSFPTKVAAAFPPEQKPTRRQLAQRKSEPEKQQEAPFGARAWGIQIGAFGDVLSAREVLLGMMRNMQDVLNEAKPSLQKITMTDGSTIYRARFIGLEQDSARSVCSHLIRKGQGCLVISGS